MSERKVPKLRFPEFSGDWENSTLNNIAKFSKGKGISKSDIIIDGETYCIRYGELYTHYNEVIKEVYSKTNLNKSELIFSEYNDVVIPASGETQIDIATASCVLKDGVALGGDLNIIKSALNGVFLSYYLNSVKKLEIASLSQGNSVVHLYATQLQQLNINYPNNIEQTKIADFLTSIDDKIEQLTKKKELLEQYKKGVMRDIFSQKIRFKDDNGNNYPDWDNKNITEVINIFNGFAFSSSDSLQHGTRWVKIADVGINEMKYDNLSYLPLDYLEKYHKYKLEHGDYIIALTRPILNNRLKIARVNKFFHNSLLNQRVGKLITNECKDYIFHLLQLDEVIKNINERILGSEPPNLSINLLSDVSIEIPCIEEQIKIANFVTSIDDKITQVSTLLEQTKLFKKSLLQQMFI